MIFFLVDVDRESVNVSSNPAALTKIHFKSNKQNGNGMATIRREAAGNPKQITKQKAQVGDNSNNQFTYDFGVHGNFALLFCCF